MPSPSKKIFVLALLILTFSGNFVLASSNYNKKTAPVGYKYSSTSVVYPNQMYDYRYYAYQQRQNENFIRNMYIISKMAEENPGVKYKYTSTSVNYL